MQFLHQTADEIYAYIKSRGLHVTKYSADGKSPPTPARPEIVKEMLATSETLWGDSLKWYVGVSGSDAESPLSLHEAVPSIERSVGENFLVVAFNDGGIFTISSKLLPFQESAKRVDEPSPAGGPRRNWSWRELFWRKKQPGP
jgi:hypothetical protein